MLGYEVRRDDAVAVDDEDRVETASVGFPHAECLAGRAVVEHFELRIQFVSEILSLSRVVENVPVFGQYDFSVAVVYDDDRGSLACVVERFDPFL